VIYEWRTRFAVSFAAACGWLALPFFTAEDADRRTLIDGITAAEQCVKSVMPKKFAGTRRAVTEVTIRALNARIDARCLAAARVVDYAIHTGASWTTLQTHGAASAGSLVRISLMQNMSMYANYARTSTIEAGVARSVVFRLHATWIARDLGRAAPLRPNQLTAAVAAMVAGDESLLMEILQ
jgi:hypothetical protein